MKNNIIFAIAAALGLSCGPVWAAEYAPGPDADPLVAQASSRPDADDDDAMPAPPDGMFPPGGGMRGLDRAFDGHGISDGKPAREGKNMKGGKPGRSGKAVKDVKAAKRGEPQGVHAGKAHYEMMKNMEAKLLEAVTSADKDFAAELTALKESDPGLYQGVAVRLGKALFVSKRVADEELFKNGVKMAKVEIAKAGLLEKYRAAKADSDKKALKSQLRDVLSQEFDLRQAFEEGRVKMVEKELADLKKAVADRKAGKSDMVNDKLTEELGEKPRW